MKAILTIGCPCSGKSTWAEDYCKETGAFEINRDNIRMSLFKLERYDDYKFSKANEEKVSVEVNRLIKNCVEVNRDIVISDTNLGSKNRKALEARLVSYGYTIEHEVFDVEFFDLLKRNQKRTDKKIPRNVMYDMHRRFQSYKKEHGLSRVYVANKDKPSAYIVDIDGTLATNDGHRGWYDWSKVGDDKPVDTVVSVVNMLYDDHKIILMSGRDEVCRKETEEWLMKHEVYYDKLYMRPEGSFEKDRIVKERMFWLHVADDYNVLGVFDDRPQVCLLWYDLGLTLFKVGDPLLEF